MDISAIGTAVWFLLINVVDAAVDAHLSGMECKKTATERKLASLK